jgi:pimeloyl-ACP methyl ester carboxylesterase
VHARLASRLALAAVVGGLALASWGGSQHAAGAPAPAATRSAWVEQQVRFRAGGMTIYGTYRHPRGGATHLPAALLIAGSGPTDRNGNQRDGLPGSVDTLRTLAHWLSDDGVASLRYDKLGSGRTGLGRFRKRLRSIGLGVFEQEAAGALRYLAARPGVDTRRLTVIGHSEGALFALLMATRHAAAVPPIHALGLVEPLSRRYLDVIDAQVEAQLASPQVPADQAAQIRRALRANIASLRSSGTISTDVPSALASLFNPSSARFLAEADRYDPAKLAARLAPHTPAIVTCSDADVQVSCGDVDHLIAGLKRSRAARDVVRLKGVDHVLKEDPSGVNYHAALPFSAQLRRELAAFVAARR